MFTSSIRATQHRQPHAPSLHDALPISVQPWSTSPIRSASGMRTSVRNSWQKFLTDVRIPDADRIDRKSTRLNSSHLVISYAVFCLKKKKIKTYSGASHNERESYSAHEL